MRIFKIKLPLLAAIVAVVFTVGTTAFTKKGNPPATYTFAYQLGTYAQADVENQANWALGSPNCTGQNKACQIEVLDQYTHVDPVTQERILNTSGSNALEIQTGTNNNSDYFVTATTGITEIANKD